VGTSPWYGAWDDRASLVGLAYARSMAIDTSAEHPAPVRTVAQLVNQWIDRLGWIWVEGQVAQLSRRPGATMAFITLRDTAADLSLPITCKTAVLASASPAITEGDRIIVFAKPTFFAPRGSFSLAAREIRHVGLGELLARLERLKSALAAEGLFATERKKVLPFLPRKIGLVCGRASAAEHDVVENVKRRWPTIEFETREVPVQGASAAAAVTAAIAELDRMAGVDVIVVTRGGGSVEDLLPFSEETMLRAVASCATPIVSAIGHEQDSPLLDLVADVRASTPTDAARQIVPSFADELATVTHGRRRIQELLRTRFEAEAANLSTLRQRPVLARPTSLIDNHAEVVDGLRHRSWRATDNFLQRAHEGLAHTRARVVALSPQATLDRGYAVVQLADMNVVRAPVPAGEPLHIRVAKGAFDAVASG